MISSYPHTVNSLKAFLFFEIGSPYLASTDFEFLFSCFSLPSAKTEMPLNRYMETISVYTTIYKGQSSNKFQFNGSITA